MQLPLLFTRATAVAAGWSPREIDSELRSGRWTSLRRGVYVRSEHLPTGGPQRVALDVAAAHLASTHGLVGSHETAALVHGLPLFRPYDGPVLLTRPREPSKGRPGLTSPSALVSQIPPAHRTVVHGAVVTTRARTAVDLSRKGGPLSSVVVLDGALRSGVSRSELDEVLHACSGWPGVRHAAERVSFADGRAESALESVGRWRMHQLQLPPPDLQLVVHDVDGPVGRVDFGWEELRTIGEADGFGKYRDRDGRADFAVLRAEKLREDRLRDAGWEVFRFTWDEAVHRPAVIGLRARRAFARATARRSG